jgi:multidrug transporter EmrE-like cation transporter
MKAIPGGTNPLTVLILVYGLAIGACAVIAPAIGMPVVMADFRRLFGWPTVMLALAVVGIEIGYLLAYRSGWTIGVTYAFASGATVAILAVIGWLYFHDAIVLKRILGLALIILGGWMTVG